MSVDTVNYALTDVRMFIVNHRDSFEETYHHTLKSICDYMRSYLMQEDVAGFNDFVNRMLAEEPDAADFILEELFIKLGITDREELSAILQ